MTRNKRSDVERIKAQSRYLRGTIVESLADPVTGAIRDDDTQVLKFHGSYQQDDRDLRDDRRRRKLEPAYQFMIRTRLPGGVCTPAQWLALDDLATLYGNGSLRLTTRQAFQLHGVIKRDLKATLAAMNRSLVDTIAACGDVNRNVICAANPHRSRLHETVYRHAAVISEHLRPRTRAYHEIWLDEEKVAGQTDAEPIYGATYLPRKFKIAIALPPVNDVDVLAHDLGFIGVTEDGVLAGYNVSVGGGMGMSYDDPETHPRLADVIGFVAPEHLREVAEAVVTLQRDHGNRENRRRARLKYTIEDRGLDWFRDELQHRLGFELGAVRNYRFEHNGDRYGWVEGFDGRWHLTLQLAAGRVVDRPGAPQRHGLRRIAECHQGEFRLTPNQNLVIANVMPDQRDDIDALVEAHGLDGYRRNSGVRRLSLACVALPTCGQAMAEAERYLPTFMDKMEALLDRHGVLSQPILVRISGCANGCSRPYLAEVALGGKAPGRYNLYLGGDITGQRLNVLYRENVDESRILEALDPLIGRYARYRRSGEPFGDFLWRDGALVAAKAQA